MVRYSRTPNASFPGRPSLEVSTKLLGEQHTNPGGCRRRAHVPCASASLERQNEIGLAELQHQSISDRASSIPVLLPVRRDTVSSATVFLNRPLLCERVSTLSATVDDQIDRFLRAESIETPPDELAVSEVATATDENPHHEPPATVLGASSWPSSF